MGESFYPDRHIRGSGWRCFGLLLPKSSVLQKNAGFLKNERSAKVGQ